MIQNEAFVTIIRCLNPRSEFVPVEEVKVNKKVEQPLKPVVQEKKIAEVKHGEKVPEKIGQISFAELINYEHEIHL